MPRIATLSHVLPTAFRGLRRLPKADRRRSRGNIAPGARGLFDYYIVCWSFIVPADAAIKRIVGWLLLLYVSVVYYVCWLYIIIILSFGILLTVAAITLSKMYVCSKRRKLPCNIFFQKTSKYVELHNLFCFALL